MNDYRVRSEQLCRLDASLYIIKTFQPFFGLNSRKRYKVRRVNRHFDISFFCGFAYNGERRVSGGYTVSALVFVGVKSPQTQPLGRFVGVLVPFSREGIAVSSRSEKCSVSHSLT